ncbi:MAG TPA: DUF1028 domain-containing protein [Solirubrobacteraceae bacterium]|nr:DUF1028 domain-containing protein [Solirubrobacteraceae bacterium]
MRRGTYSIVARDPGSGELGVAVQSHWFSVGSVVSWARPGVGAAATQSVAETAHGPGMLQKLAEGHDAPSAIAAVLEHDDLARYRQLGIVDAHGHAASYTGPDCIPYAGDVVGEGFACQANMMAREGVPEAMAGAFRHADGELAERLLAALRAAEQAGGDVRGRQSAALVVAPVSGEPWRTRVEVRVDDSPQPLDELARLVRLARAYELAGAADELLAEGEGESANALYLRAAELAPEADELAFWAGIGVAGSDMERGLELVRRAVAVKDSWLVLLERLPADLAPAASAVKAELERQP